MYSWRLPCDQVFGKMPHPLVAAFATDCLLDCLLAALLQPGPAIPDTLNPKP